MELCAIDNGYFGTKVKTAHTLFSFPSRIQYATNLHSKDSMILEYNGKKYVVGSGKDSIEINKTGSELHKICALSALAKIANINSRFNLVLSLPLIHYKNHSYREAFREYMLGEKCYSLKLNGIQKNFYINDAFVFAQGAAAIYEAPERYKNRIVALIDFGGGTINGCIFENLNIIPESIFTINEGILILFNKIKTALNEVLCLNIQNYEIPYLFNKEPDKKIGEIISSVLEEHFSTLKREIENLNSFVRTI